MSFNPDQDGGRIWDYMHLMAGNAVTPRKRELYVDWLNSLKECFPCEKCRIHLIANLEQLPAEPYMKSNISLFYHSWKLHDTVNGQLNKPMAQRLTYDQAFEKYFGRAPPTMAAQSTQTAQPQTSNPQMTQSRRAEPQQRFLTNAAREETGSPEHKVCSSCAPPVIQTGRKENFDEYRKAKKKVFTTKN